MERKKDDIKGRVKEAAGDLTAAAPGGHVLARRPAGLPRLPAACSLLETTVLMS
jgi:hypothetical protein